MISKNYQITSSGVLVASGAGAATLTSHGQSYWAIGDSAVTAPSMEIMHTAHSGENISLMLEAAEYLWVFGNSIVAVTAENPAAGEL